MEYEFKVTLYDKLVLLKEKYLRDTESFRLSTSKEEKESLCDEINKTVIDFRSLKSYYVRYNNNPTEELMNEIKDKFGILLGLVTEVPDLPETPRLEDTIIEKPRLHEVGSMTDVPVEGTVAKPVLKSTFTPREETEKTIEKPVLKSTVGERNDDLKNASDWSNELGYSISDATGFNPDQLDPDYKMSAAEFLDGVFYSKYERVPLEEDNSLSLSR